MIDWKRVAHDRNVKLREFMHAEAVRTTNLEEWLGKELFMALHSACIGDALAKSQEIAKRVAERLRITP